MNNENNYPPPTINPLNFSCCQWSITLIQWDNLESPSKWTENSFMQKYAFLRKQNISSANSMGCFQGYPHIDGWFPSLSIMHSNFILTDASVRKALFYVHIYKLAIRKKFWHQNNEWKYLENNGLMGRYLPPSLIHLKTKSQTFR